MKHRLFLDANVLVSLLLKEYPSYTWSARLLSMAERPSIELVTTPVVIAIAYYFSEKKHGTVQAHQRIARLTEYLSVCPVSEHHVNAALKHSKPVDLEDAIQYHAAIDYGCTLLVTDNKADFWYSDIPVLNAKEALSFLITDSASRMRE